jgi:hypothetical protein
MSDRRNGRRRGFAGSRSDVEDPFAGLYFRGS